MKNFEKELVKTPIHISFPEETTDYECYFNPSNQKCYYQVNDEFLMIVDPGKVREIKQWFNISNTKKRSSDEEE